MIFWYSYQLYEVYPRNYVFPGLYGGFLKWWYPQIIHFNRVFHYFHHPFWGTQSFPCFPKFRRIDWRAGGEGSLKPKLARIPMLLGRLEHIKPWDPNRGRLHDSRQNLKNVKKSHRIHQTALATLTRKTLAWVVACETNMQCNKYAVAALLVLSKHLLNHKGVISIAQISIKVIENS